MPIPSVTLPPPPASRGAVPAGIRRGTAQRRVARALLAGLASGTLVRTLTGTTPVERLLAGDTLIDADNQIVALRGRFVLRAEDSERIILHPGALEPGAGIDRTLVVGPDQQLVVDDWRMQLLHGGAAPVAAWRLEDGMMIRRIPADGAVLHVLQVDRPCWLRANGHRVALGSAAPKPPACTGGR